MGFVRVVVLHGDDGHHVVGPILRTTIRYGASGRARSPAGTIVVLLMNG